MPFDPLAASQLLRLNHGKMNNRFISTRNSKQTRGAMMRMRLTTMPMATALAESLD
jgi:hypothetical protein